LTPPAAGTARRWLLPPRTFAKLLQLADIGDADRILDVGAGTGYGAAVLAGFARSVLALECDPALAAALRANVAALDLSNVRVVERDLSEGCVEEGPYDAIVLQGSVPDAPMNLLDQLKDGGRLVGVVRRDGLGKAMIWRRLGRSLDQRTAFDAAATELPGFATAPEFVL
jgi:protein-L-isoaspartate(D-aspartate) O-methyltransferase